MATVFLDLDGTLTDAGEGILNSVDYALRKLSLPGLSGDCLLYTSDAAPTILRV